MAEWLDEEWRKTWADGVHGASLADDVSGRLRVQLSGGPGGDASGVLVVDGGTVVGWGPESDDEADAVLTMPAAEARELLAGTVEPSVAFMRGRLKVTGDMRLVLAVLAATTGDGYQAGRRRLLEATTETEGDGGHPGPAPAP